MTMDIGAPLLVAAAIGILLLAAQGLALARHLRRGPQISREGPPVSILKPLCGLDDHLARNLENFAHLDYPEYEVLLGLKTRDDPAFAPACAICARWPGRFRLVLQRGEPGANPKVNQLVTLAASAAHEILVVSDSNVRVHADYLSEIAGLLADPAVGLVTHLVAGVGEERVGSALESLHLTGSMAPGVAAAKWLAGRDIVIGKSMAVRRGDLASMGGFEAVKDVLAEDYVLGLMTSRLLGKRVALARRPVENVTSRRAVREFVSRFQRWHVMQRRSVGFALYLAQGLLNPVFLAFVALALSPGMPALAGFAGACIARMVLDGAAGRALRGFRFRFWTLALVPAKDLLIGMAWIHGLLVDRVNWRGNQLRVLTGTRIELPEAAQAPVGAGRSAAA